MGWSGGDRRQAIGSMLPVPQIWRVLNPVGVPATPRMPHGVGGTRDAAKKPRPADRSRLLTPNWGSGGWLPSIGAPLAPAASGNRGCRR